MGMRTPRFIVVTAAAALALTSIAVTPASAHYRHWHHGNAAVLGAVLGVFGTIAAVAAANRYRDDYYAYGYGEPYYYAPYGYYSGGSYGYAPRYRYRGGRHYSYHRHRH